MDAVMATPTPAAEATQRSDRFILTQVGAWQLLFPQVWVTEIFRVQQSLILELPFAHPLLLGVTHHGGVILPLVTAQGLMQLKEQIHRKTLTVIHLSAAAGKLGEMGLVVEKALGSLSREQLPDSLFTTIARQPVDTQSLVLVQPDWLPEDLWQPQI